jgi:hypothetical protein
MKERRNKKTERQRGGKGIILSDVLEILEMKFKRKFKKRNSRRSRNSINLCIFFIILF